MGLISRVSSRTYRRKTNLFFASKWPIKRERLPNNRSKSPTSESPSALRTRRPSTRLALRFAAELKTSTPEVPRLRLKSRDHDLCQPDECESPLERRHAVRVQKPGTDSKCEFISESSSSFAVRVKS